MPTKSAFLQAGLRKMTRLPVAAFAIAAVILLPHLFYFIPLRPVGLVENRVLAELPRPPATLAELGALPSRFDAYIQDNFPLRSHIIATMNYLRYLDHYSTTKNVIVGKDGWLFYDNGTHLAHARGKAHLSESELDVWVTRLAERVAYARSNHTGLYLLPAPQKETIYPEKVPNWLAAGPDTFTAIDQIIQRASKRGFDQIIDSRAALLSAKATRLVYDRYDTHWNGHGAYVAYRELMTRISRDYPAMVPLPESYFPFAPEPAGDMARMLGIAGAVKDVARDAPVPIHDDKRTTYLTDNKVWSSPYILETGVCSGPTLLLIRDSFATDLIPLLEPHFSRLIVVHLQDGFFRKDLIEQYHPDITVVEVIENGFQWAMN
jgi:alginate O-acetyltransferase complex protein AlgJ